MAAVSASGNDGSSLPAVPDRQAGGRGAGPASPRQPVQRIAPHSIQAEACVLGSMLLDAPTIDVIVQSLSAEHFYRPAHQLIFQALVRMRDEKRPIDLVSAREELGRQNQLEQVGGVEYLVALAEGVPNAANAEYYARIVREKAMLREVIAASNETIREAYDARDEAEDVVDRAEQRVFEIRNQTIGREAATIKSLLTETFKTLEEHDGRMITGLASGYQKLDELTCGFQKGEVVVLAGRPSMGKTSCLLNIAEYMAVVDRVPLAFFSMEMASRQIVQRLLASHARFDMQRMRRGMISAEDWSQLQLSAGDLEQAPLYIDDTGVLTILQLRAKARRLKAAHDIRAVFVDYLQLMTYTGRSDSRQEQITEISRGIKALARDLDIPIIVAAQLNRGPEDRTYHRPRMSDLRESGSIEQDADLILLLHCEDYYHRGEPNWEPKNVTELIIAKQRNGPTDTVELTFLPQCVRFEQGAPLSFAP
jgi:replicative DNA helicase